MGHSKVITRSYTLINVYTKRREKVKQRMMRYTRMIRSCKVTIRRIKKREAVVREAKAISERFFGFKLALGNRSPDYVKGRQMFCKFLLERKTSGKCIEIVMNYSRGYPSLCRKALIKAFTTHPETRQQYHRYRSHMESILDNKALKAPANEPSLVH
jgi:hypothetical protein